VKFRWSGLCVASTLSMSTLARAQAASAASGVVRSTEQQQVAAWSSQDDGADSMVSRVQVSHKRPQAKRDQLKTLNMTLYAHR
jgi:hypothetical protein